ncbi:MAG: hypothetical protein C0501_27565 [Isosphaera sp.]|nr:hypothetical protein [Isosphaera sp.]
MKVKLFAAAVLSVALGHTAAADDKKTIAENVAASKDHTILLALVKEAGLAETLGGKGPFTVFGPTDEAFKKLPKELVEKVKGDKELLKKVLMLHVIPGKAVMAADVKGLDGKEVNGFKIDTKDGVKIGPAKVTTADIKASNGVIHVIDTVLVPGK